MSTEYVNFSVSGDFVTNLARTWLWEERKPYTVVEEFLMSCLLSDAVTTEQKKEIIVGILEGRYKLEGVNEVTLEEDNEYVRPLSDYIRLQERDIMIAQIKDDMNRHPLMYVDEYSSIKSYAALCKLYPMATMQDVIQWYSDRPDDEKPLWLFNRAAMIYDLISGPINEYNRKTFFDKLYDLIGDDGSDRQKRYEMTLNIKPKNNSISNNDDDYMFKEMNLNYLFKPDNYTKDTGWIAPNGEYYSCEFGGHTVKSNAIVKNNPKIKAQFSQWMTINFIDGEIMSQKHKGWKIPIGDRYAEFLLENGWVKFHNPHFGESFPEFYKKPTKEQQQTLFDVCTHFEYKHNYGLDIFD